MGKEKESNLVKENVSKINESICYSKKEDNIISITRVSKLVIGKCLKRCDGIYDKITNVVELDIENEAIIYNCTRIIGIYGVESNRQSINLQCIDHINIKDMQHIEVKIEEFNEHLYALLNCIFEKSK